MGSYVFFYSLKDESLYEPQCTEPCRVVHVGEVDAAQHPVRVPVVHLAKPVHNNMQTDDVTF